MKKLSDENMTRLLQAEAAVGSAHSNLTWAYNRRNKLSGSKVDPGKMRESRSDYAAAELEFYRALDNHNQLRLELGLKPTYSWLSEK